MRNKVIGIEGMPGSGKTTFVKRFVKKYKNTLLIESKDICMQLAMLLKNNMKLLENSSNISVDYEVKNNTVNFILNKKRYDIDKNTFDLKMLLYDFPSSFVYQNIKKVICAEKDNYQIIIDGREILTIYPEVNRHIIFAADSKVRFQRIKLRDNNNYSEFKKREKKENNLNCAFDSQTFNVDTTSLTEEEVFAKVETIINNNLVTFISGPSSGKTTISKYASKMLNEPWREEYSRKSYQNKGSELTVKELIKVAEDQDKYENQYLHEAKKWVFCDANVLNIYLYSCHTYQVDNIILKEMSYKIKYRFDYIFSVITISNLTVL